MLYHLVRQGSRWGWGWVAMEGIYIMRQCGEGSPCKAPVTAVNI